jgi:hypothetical protein
MVEWELAGPAASSRSLSGELDLGAAVGGFDPCGLLDDELSLDAALGFGAENPAPSS